MAGDNGAHQNAIISEIIQPELSNPSWNFREYGVATAELKLEMFDNFEAASFFAEKFK